MLLIVLMRKQVQDYANIVIIPNSFNKIYLKKKILISSYGMDDKIVMIMWI